METVLLYISGFAFLAIQGFATTILSVGEADIQGLFIKKLIRKRYTLIISLILPLLSWIQLFDINIYSLLIIVGANTIITLFLSPITAWPFLILIPSKMNKGGQMLKTFLIGVITLLIGSLL